MDGSDLRDLEQNTFRTVADDGLWDVLVAMIFAMLAVAPLLSEQLGDFWSSAVFLPIWAGVFVGIRMIRRHVVEPRVGTVRFGAQRLRKLRRLSVVLLLVNIASAIAGMAAFFGVQAGWISLGDDSLAYPLVLFVTCLVGFSAAALITGITRYYAYGLMAAAAPIVGEWLWRNDLATHHGFPIVFGATAVIILGVGIARLLAVVRQHQRRPHGIAI